VTNSQPLATIRIFSHFSIDIHTYHLYNCSRMVRNERTDAERRNAGCPSTANLRSVPHTDRLPSGLPSDPSAVLSSLAKEVGPVTVKGPAKKEGFAEEAGQVRSRQDEEGGAVLRPPPFPLSAFCFPNFRFTEPSIRVVLRYFELIRVNSSSASTIHRSKFTIISTPPLQHSVPIKANQD